MSGCEDFYDDNDRAASSLYHKGLEHEQNDEMGEAIEAWQQAYAIWYELSDANPDFSSKEYDELTDKIGDLLETELDGYD